MPRGKPQGHEQVVEYVVFPGTPTFVEAVNDDGWLQLWLEETVPGESSAGTKKFLYQLLLSSSTTLHLSAMYSTGHWM